MTRKDAENLYEWLTNTYPRNYKDADARRDATTVDNLATVFAKAPFADVLTEYKRVMARQKNEPHPSEILAALAHDRKATHKVEPGETAYEALKRNPKYAEIERAYGERATRRAAKLCQHASINELQFHLQYDIPCREGDFLHRKENR